MKKQLLIPILLAFCSYKSNAQFQVNTGAAAPTNTVMLTNGPNTSTGTNSVIVGNAAGPSNTGQANTFVGQATGFSNTSGWANVFLGAWTGGANLTGTANTFVGQYCGINNTSGGGNIFIGQGCASNSTTGGDNTIVGTSAAGSNTSGNYNVFIGRIAGTNNTTGSYNTALGYNAGFGSGALTNATAIGQNAQASASNTVILGGTGSNAVNVGVGTSSPASHVHTVNSNAEDIRFETTNTGGTSATTVSLTAPSTSYPLDNLKLIMNGYTNSGILLPAIGSAPVIPLANSGEILTEGSALAIGFTNPEKIGSIHFINNVTDYATSTNKLTECMRINKTTGFVGIHTRTATTAGTTGEPQALFHVNLTNPANGNLIPLTQGIRFEGLPHAAYDSVIVIDNDGNLAKAPYRAGSLVNAWLLTGNTTSGTQFIGTLVSDDFRIRTNNLQRARFTEYGNFDLGSNLTASTTTDTSQTIGNRNILDNAHTALSLGIDNDISDSWYSTIAGQNNTITNSANVQVNGIKNNIDNSHSSFIAGMGNAINSSDAVAILGAGSTISNSNQSAEAGEDNTITNGHGVFVGGGHNQSDGIYNLLLGNNMIASPAAVPMVSPGPSFDNIMAIGEYINSDLRHSLSTGFLGNRTTVTTQRGLAVQLDPTALNTYNPTVNFEVNASPTGAPAMGPCPLNSNIRFHNLPQDPLGRMLPAVLIDPATGELFMSQASYLKPSGSSNNNLDSLYKENESLKSQIAQLQSKLSGYDEKFASLERSLVQICEGGCAGLNIHNNDELYQSIPNPTNNDVNISYYLSANYSNASISIITMDGKAVRSYSVNPNKGNGTLNISLGELQPGVYLYNLVVDGKQVGTKKLQKQ